MHTEVSTTVYRSGGRSKAVDIHAPAAGGAGASVLLWHGTGPDERDVLAPLAREIAPLGPTVLVPDWQPDLPDGGRAQLADSLRFALSRSADGSGGPLVVGGWSAGAGAAMGTVLEPGFAGDRRIAAVAAIAGDFGRPARSTGAPPLDALRPDHAPLPVRLVHGTEDTVVPVDSSRALHRALRALGWDVRLTEPAVDHAGVLGCVYDPAVRRCVPSAAEPAMQAMRRAAAEVAAVAAGR